MMDDQIGQRHLLTAFGTSSIALSAGCIDQLSGGIGDDSDDDTASVGDGQEQNATPPAIDYGELIDDFEYIKEWTALEGEITPDEEQMTNSVYTLRSAIPIGTDSESCPTNRVVCY